MHSCEILDTTRELNLEALMPRGYLPHQMSRPAKSYIQDKTLAFNILPILEF